MANQHQTPKKTTKPLNYNKGRVIAEAGEPVEEQLTVGGFLVRVLRWMAFLSVVIFFWFHVHCPTAAQLRRNGASTSLELACVSFHSEAAPLYNSVYYKSLVRHTTRVGKKLNEIEAYRAVSVAVEEALKAPAAAATIETYKRGVDAIAEQVAYAVANAEPTLQSIARSEMVEVVLQAGEKGYASVREALMPVYHHEGYKVMRTAVHDASESLSNMYKIGSKIWNKNVQPQLVAAAGAVGQALHQIFTVVDKQLDALLAPQAK